MPRPNAASCWAAARKSSRSRSCEVWKEPARPSTACWPRSTVAEISAGEFSREGREIGCLDALDRSDVREHQGDGRGECGETGGSDGRRATPALSGRRARETQDERGQDDHADEAAAPMDRPATKRFVGRRPTCCAKHEENNRRPEQTRNDSAEREQQRDRQRGRGFDRKGAPSPNQPGSDAGLQRRDRANAEGRREGERQRRRRGGIGVAGNVEQEGAENYAEMSVSPAQDRGGERNAGRGQDQRLVSGQDGERQTETPDHEIGRCREKHDPGRGGCRDGVTSMRGAKLARACHRHGSRDIKRLIDEWAGRRHAFPCHAGLDVQRSKDFLWARTTSACGRRPGPFGKRNRPRESALRTGRTCRLANRRDRSASCLRAAIASPARLSGTFVTQTH